MSRFARERPSLVLSTVQLTSAIPDVARALDRWTSVRTRHGMLSKAKVASAQQQGDFFIKPETVQPVLSTSEWPLLLKNYDKLLVRSSHFTPIPSGCSPLKRDIASYIKLVFRITSSLFSTDGDSLAGLVLSTWTNRQTLLHTKLSPG